MTAMAVKKERGRFSLRFNISDPIHLATVELLEKQPDHGKAQYIANAVVFYNTHFADDPQPLRAAAPPPAIDRAAIEAIVREILRQEARTLESLPAPRPPAGCRNNNGPGAAGADAGAGICARAGRGIGGGCCHPRPDFQHNGGFSPGEMIKKRGMRAALLLALIPLFLPV